MPLLGIVLVASTLAQDTTKDAPTAASTPEKPAWSVESPPGEDVTVAIDVREGTWMSVDVSPDGQNLVFDLLGDLYTLPIAGGEARPLTSGIAWDMQPTWSPSGEQIAFTSDRGGGDNLWVIDAGGGEPRAVSEESFRLLNSPAWSPDGAFIAGRKHFTKGRSLGSGEIWLYPLDGPKGGLQLTERPDDQKDVGEPAFSPDGRYVYWSRDASGGTTFQYNKDPNGSIYVIERLDRMTGEIERVTGGPGGAIRPVPAPDGRHLAFVRRVRAKSVLTIRDLVTGQERAVWDGLDRDMQETWAIHGVYPSFDWLPDGTGLVLWAGGSLQRVSLDGTAEIIPFHVSDTRTVRPALRRPVTVAPDAFDVRSVRDTAVSPDGTRVAFEALGQIWVRDLPDGAPVRLTRDEGVVELDPAWSPDGKFIIYATWSDSELGAIRRTKSSGRKKSEILTAEPGHYTSPTVSGDGERIAFQKVTGGWLRTPLWSNDPGVYVMSVAGGTPERVARSGRRPHFGPDANILYRLVQSGEKLELRSLDLDDREERTLARTEMGTDIRISPDGRWLVWREHHGAHVMPFVQTGRPQDLARESGSNTVVKISEDAGYFLDFSKDGEQVHWTLGPHLFTANLYDVVARDADAKLTWKTEQAASVSLGFTWPSDSPTGVSAIVGARILPMTGGSVIEDGTILWEGNRIVTVGKRAEIGVPPDAHVIDGTGKTVMPGLVDVHAHGSQGRSGIVPQQNWGQLSNLSFGVTTIHDPSNDTETFFAASERQRAGTLLAPRLFSTGTILYGAKSPGATAKVDSLDDALSHLRRMQAIGAFSVKSYNQPRRDQRQQVVEAGRQLNMMVVPEGGSLLMHNLTQVVDGHTGVEHAIPVARAYADVLQLWGGTEVGYTPTLGVAYGGLSGEKYFYGEERVWENERLLAFVPRTVVDPASRRGTRVPEAEYNHIEAARTAKKLSDAGVRVNIGAHGQREGLAAHWEIWMLHQGGFTPLEALRAATLNGAWYLGLDGDIGSLEAGKLADILVIDGNPLDDIRQSERVELTILNGRVYEAATMNQLHPEPHTRLPLWFQTEGGGQAPTQTETHACGCARQ